MESYILACNGVLNVTLIPFVCLPFLSVYTYGGEGVLQ